MYKGDCIVTLYYYIIKNRIIMKTLTQFIYEGSLTYESFFDNNDNLITEGFWAKIKAALGIASTDELNELRNMLAKIDDKELSNDITTMQTVAAVSKDPKIKELANKTLRSLAKCDSVEEVINELIKVSENVIKNNNIKHSPATLVKIKNILAEQKGNKKALKTAKALGEWLQKEFPNTIEKAETEVKNITKKVEKSGIGDPKNIKPKKKNNTESVSASDDNSTLGISKDGEPEVVSQEQETAAVTDIIKDDIEFFKPLAEATNVNADQMRESIVNLINKSLKEQSKDKEGNIVYKWKVDTKGFKTKNEPNLIKGLAAILSGIVLINHKGMSEKIVDTLIGFGFSKDDISKALK